MRPLLYLSGSCILVFTLLRSGSLLLFSKPDSSLVYLCIVDCIGLFSSGSLLLLSKQNSCSLAYLCIVHCIGLFCQSVGLLGVPCVRCRLTLHYVFTVSGICYILTSTIQCLILQNSIETLCFLMEVWWSNVLHFLSFYRKFTTINLAQIKHILPEAVKIDKVLRHDVQSKCMVPEMKIELLYDIVEGHGEESVFLALSSLLSSRLKEFCAAHPEVIIPRLSLFFFFFLFCRNCTLSSPLYSIHLVLDWFRWMIYVLYWCGVTFDVYQISHM